MSTIEVKNFSTKDVEGNEVSFTVDSQILDYVEPARTFGAADLAEATAGLRYQPTVVAIPDQRPMTVTPMMLSMGSEQTLRLVRRVANGEADLPASYEMIDLSAGFAHIAEGTVRAFAAGWTTEDEVTLAVAVDSPALGNPSQILIAYNISTRHADWSNLPWVNYGTRNSIKIDGMRVIREGDGKWLTLMSGGAGILADAYVIRQDRPGSFQTGGMVYSSGIDLTDIADFQVGGVDGDAALHVLGTNHRGKRVVITRKVPSLDATGNPVPTPVMTFRCPASANVLALGRNDPARGADLYVGGKGVQCLDASEFDEQEEASFESVIPEAAAIGIERVVVAEGADGVTTVWALDGAGRLLITSRPQREPGTSTQVTWSEPIAIRRGVHEIAAVPGDKHLTAAVLVIYDRGQTSSLVRDAQGIWQDEPITVADAGAATRLLTFQTVVSLRDENCIPARGRVRLSASVASTLVLNGHSHFVYPGNDAMVDIPYDGKLTISNRALSFSPATYRIKVDGWRDAIDINPAARMYQRFETLTADDLRKARKADGQPLLDEEFRTGSRSGSVDSLVQALKKATEMSTHKEGGSDGVWLVADNAEFSSKVEADALPDGYSWGLASDGKGSLIPMDAAAANSLTGRAGHASAGIAGFSISLSDIWESIANAASEAVRFVVRKAADVVEFICEIGGKVGRFILDRLEEIGSFFKWLWSSIKTAAEDVWNFLKFLFDWDDILGVRDRMKETVKDQLESLKAGVQQMRPVVAGYFDEGIQKIVEMKKERGLSVSTPAAKDPISQARKEGTNTKDDVVNSGPGSWILEQFSNISKSLIDIEMPATEANFDLMEVLNEQLGHMSSMSDNVGKDINAIFAGKFPSLSDITFAKLEQVVMSVGLNIAEGALEMGKTTCLALLDAMASLIDIFRKVLFARVRLPLLEKLWELVSGEKRDLSFSIIDVVLLPPALLGTIAFKLAFPKVDIKKVLEIRLPPDNVVAIQSSGLKAAAYFIKDVVSTFLNFVGIMFDGLSSATELVQKDTGAWGWFCWTAGFLGHLIPGGLMTGAKKAVSVVLAMEALSWFTGFTQHVVKFYKNALPTLAATAFIAEAKFVAGFELVTGIVRCLLKLVALLVDRDSNYAVLEMVQFFGNAGGKILTASAKLIDELETKAVLTAGAMLAALYLGLVPGLLHNFNVRKEILAS